VIRFGPLPTDEKKGSLLASQRAQRGSEEKMTGISEKEVGGVLSVALAANMALNGHLIAKLVHVGVISAEHAAEIFVKTADSIERPLGVLQYEEPEATKVLRQYAQSIREMAGEHSESR
jgi:hypothetical protein